MSPVGQLFYTFLIFTKSEKEFIHSIQNLSKEIHTSQYIAKKIIEVIESVGPKKFSAVMSDNASSMVKAKKLINKKYENIMPIRCIDHQINLITTDIYKLTFAQNLLSFSQSRRDFTCRNIGKDDKRQRVKIICKNVLVY